MRLAESKGCLRGRNSRVQDRALQMLLVLHRIEKVKDLFAQIKIKALDRDIDLKRLRSLFPEHFPVDPFEGAYDEEGNIDPDLVDDDALTWSLPADASEDERISAWIREREQGTITGAVLNEWV